MSFKCRICDSHSGDMILHMAEMPLTDDFINVGMVDRLEYLADINIYRCQNCGVVQNPNDFDHESYYQDYEYSSGHSEFTKRFMDDYAKQIVGAFYNANKRPAKSILEVGSGDGEQLLRFRSFGAETLLGIEPSEYLADVAEKSGITTIRGLFSSSILDLIPSPIDVCLSSYTFDHVRDPIDYLKSANALLVDGGVLALEIHDFEKIVKRTEYCLFEHEHTIYMTSEDVSRILSKSGFLVVAINPVSSDLTRGNSLIAIAVKVGSPEPLPYKNALAKGCDFSDFQSKVASTVNRIDKWILELPEGSSLVGFGAGGRGVMTLAALSEAEKIEALFDSNYKSNSVLSPKTRIPVVGPDDWDNFKDSYCIVFSFGYYQEILQSLIAAGFSPDRVVSLSDFYPS